MLKGHAIKSAQVFLKDPLFKTIVNLTNLSPKESWTVWEDPEGNRLKIAKNKSVIISPSNTEPITTKDIFRKAEPECIYKHSCWGLFISGKKHKITHLIGNDGLLRCCYYYNDIWQCNFQSLLLGYHNLMLLSERYSNKTKQTTNTNKVFKIKYPKEFEIEEIWDSWISINDI
ncbi:MAG: hypothetical protein WC942_06555 [Clostridia bacterium]|jgi:hypothetical protein